VGSVDDRKDGLGDGVGVSSCFWVIEGQDSQDDAMAGLIACGLHCLQGVESV
jgi:hypothetical protein